MQSEKLIESLDVMAGLLKFHHHSNMTHDLVDGGKGLGDVVYHRLWVIGIGVFLEKFLRSLVPIEKVGVADIKWVTDQICYISKDVL